MQALVRRVLIPAAALSMTLLGLAPARGEQARSADAFVETIGICTHWSFPNTPYGADYEGVRRRLLDLGVRHVRDGFNNRILDLARFGIKTCVVAEPELGPVESIRDRIKEINGQRTAIDAVEGPNEPDLFWINRAKSYGGKSAIKGTPDLVAAVTLFQKDLYTALKADAATAPLKVIGPALGKSYDPAGVKNPFDSESLADLVDWGNFHPYPGGNPFCAQFAYGGLDKYYAQGNMPSCNIDEFPHAFDIYQPPFGRRTMAATETGYSTYKDGASELSQAKYVPRLFAEYFRKGIARTYLYELLDEFPDMEHRNREANFGLLRNDLEPKPAYHALRSLVRLVEDKEAKEGFRPNPLDVTIEAHPAEDFRKTQFVHHLLLGKSNGEYLLLLWHEVSNEDTSKAPHRQITPPDLPATVTFKANVRRAQVYTYDANWNLSPTIVTFDNGTLPIKVQDRITVIRVLPIGRS